MGTPSAHVGNGQTEGLQWSRRAFLSLLRTNAGVMRGVDFQAVETVVNFDAAMTVKVRSHTRTRTHAHTRTQWGKEGSAGAARAAASPRHSHSCGVPTYGERQRGTHQWMDQFHPVSGATSDPMARWT